MYNTQKFATYTYCGAVVNKFGVVVAHKWKGTTRAPSLMKAQSNLLYQFKNYMGATSNTTYKFLGQVHEVE